MSNAEANGRRPRRIVVLLDASHASMAALEAAVELAAHRNTELLAVFVEEEELLRCAGYPWTREVGLSGAVRPIETTTVEERMRDRAEEVRSALQRSSQRRGVAARLQVCRGRVVHEALALVGSGDFLVLGKVGYARCRGLRLGSTARAIVHGAPGPVMVFEESARRERARNVAVVVAPGEAGLTTLRYAQALLGDRETLSLAIPDAPEDGHALRQSEAAQCLRTHYPQARWLDEAATDAEHLAAALMDGGVEKVIVSRRSTLLAHHGPRSLIESIRIPVIVTP